MEISEIARAFAQALKDRDLDAFANYLSDDFVFVGVFPEPLGKEAYLAWLRAILRAFPDMSLNQKILPSADQNTLREMVQFTGTHTGDLDLPLPGWCKVPATGTSVVLPPEPVEVYFRNGKVIRILTHEASGGDWLGIIGHLGMEPPGHEERRD
jgi:predicted ester cyclase